MLWFCPTYCCFYWVARWALEFHFWFTRDNDFTVVGSNKCLMLWLIALLGGFSTMTTDGYDGLRMSSRAQTRRRKETNRLRNLFCTARFCSVYTCLPAERLYVNLNCVCEWKYIFSATYKLSDCSLLCCVWYAGVWQLLHISVAANKCLAEGMSMFSA